MPALKSPTNVLAWLAFAAVITTAAWLRLSAARTAVGDGEGPPTDVAAGAALAPSHGDW